MTRRRKPRLGRPPLASPRSTCVFARLTANERARVEAAAREAGLSLSAFVRARVLAEPLTPRAGREVAR